MALAIEEAEKSCPEDQGRHPKVGAIATDDSGTILGRAHRNEGGSGEHAEQTLLDRLRAAGIDPTILFVTLEPCRRRGDEVACLTRIKQSTIKTVYLGSLDPHPAICGLSEFLLRDHCRVERFPHELVQRISDQNKEEFERHRQTIPMESIYASQRISEIMSSSLERAGIRVGELPSEWDISLDYLLEFCRPFASRADGSTMADEEILQHLATARAVAFDRKYATYDYEKDDVRGMHPEWKEEVRGILTSMGKGDLANQRVIDVGIGNGLEANGLLEDVTDLIAVDIAPKSLVKARDALPRAQICEAPAEALKVVGRQSRDVYLSLRTYQSAYFDIERALREAYRVTRSGGVVLLSIANGFKTKGGGIERGLLYPKSETVSYERPFALVERIRQKLQVLKFESIGVRTGVAEVYVWGRRRH